MWKNKHGGTIHPLLTQLLGWILSNGGSKERCKQATLSVLISEPHLSETTWLLLLWFYDENVPDYFRETETNREPGGWLHSDGADTKPNTEARGEEMKSLS